MKYAILAIVLALAGCKGAPISQTRTGNPSYQVEFLFEFEGCRFYRFDDFHSVYFMRCKDGKSTISWNENCGKNCTRHATMLED